MNMQINYDTWQKHFLEDQPHVAFCGHVALRQLRRGRHFLSEQPNPTWIWTVKPWDQVEKFMQVEKVVIDQCAVNQRIEGKLVKKQTQVAVSHAALAEPFRGLRCNGRHEHAETWGVSSKLKMTQTWTWEFASVVVEARIALRREYRRGPKHFFEFPTTDAQADETESRRETGAPPSRRNALAPGRCVPCSQNQSQYRAEHTRIPPPDGDC